MEMDKDTFHASTFIPVLDVLLCELKRRFSKDNCDTLIGIQAVNPSSPTFCDQDAISVFASKYNCIIDDLTYEVPRLKRLIVRKQKKWNNNTRNSTSNDSVY